MDDEQVIGAGAISLALATFILFWFGVVEPAEAAVVLLTLLVGLAAYIPWGLVNANRRLEDD